MRLVMLLLATTLLSGCVNCYLNESDVDTGWPANEYSGLDACRWETWIQGELLHNKSTWNNVAEYDCHDMRRECTSMENCEWDWKVVAQERLGCWHPVRMGKCTCNYDDLWEYDVDYAAVNLEQEGGEE